MANELVNMSDQFKGLPMEELIGGPLNAACDAQVKLAQATADFIKVVGFNSPKDTDDPYSGGPRTALFRFKRPIDNPAGTPGEPGSILEEEVELDVPLLSIVKVPNLSITTVDITFDMEVKSSFCSKETEDKKESMSAEASVELKFFKAKAKIQGSVATHKENTRKSDNSAKYHVAVHAEDKGMPEGLARVMDILQTACAPRAIGAAQSVQALEKKAPASEPKAEAKKGK